MTQTDQRLGPGQGQSAQLDFRLVPKIEPIGMQCFGDIDRRVRRRVEMPERGGPHAQFVVVERRRQQGQHIESQFFSDATNRESHRRAFGAKDQDIAFVSMPMQGFEHRIGGQSTA
jgi:hypothetical protein